MGEKGDTTMILKGGKMVKDRGPRKDQPEDFIIETDYIKIKFQNGPKKEVKVNGCQVEDVIVELIKRLEVLNELFPCPENHVTLHHLREAMRAQEERTKTREYQGVEGRSKNHKSE